MLTRRTALLSLMAAAVLAACNQQSAGNSASAAAGNAGASAASGTKRIAVTAIVEHPALDGVRAGAIEQLKAEGFEEGKNIIIEFQSAQGNPATATQIAKKFAGDKPDVVLAISTPSAQAMAAASKNIPIVYAAVTDPVAAKLVPSWEASNTNITGVSDLLPLEPQIDLMRKLVPNLKNVGYVYSPGEINSTVVLEQLKTALSKQNINLVPVAAQRTTDILPAARSLGGKAQLIYTSLDNNVVASYESMYKAATEIKVPLVASDTGSFARGAVAVLGVNYHDIGVEAGKIIARILRGEATGSIPSQRMSKFDLYLSPKHAREQGITIPDELLKTATQVTE